LSDEKVRKRFDSKRQSSDEAIKDASLLMPQMTPLFRSPFDNEEIRSGTIDIERH